MPAPRTHTCQWHVRMTLTDGQSKQDMLDYNELSINPDLYNFDVLMLVISSSNLKTLTSHVPLVILNHIPSEFSDKASFIWLVFSILANEA